MKKTNKLIHNNRGAALITIMIAVAFVSILASAILYLSFSNFQMKLANYESKVNFYGTEKDVTELSTTLRNTLATNPSDPEGALKTAVGHAPVNGVERYNPASLAALVYPSPSGNTATFGDTIATFSTSIPEDQANYVTDSTTGKITLRGVVVEHKDSDGYMHKITTDMIFYVKESPAGTDAGGVGEFSVMTDQPITVSGSSTRAVMYGNVYVGPGNYTGVVKDNATSARGKKALTLSNSSYLAQCGDYMIVFGDITLNNKAYLNVTGGKLTVLGDIIINDNATFMCSGELFMPAGCNITGNTNNAHYNAVTELSNDDYNNMLDTIGLTNAKEDGLVANILTKDGLAMLKAAAGETSKADYIYESGVYYYNILWGQADLNSQDVRNALVLNVKGTDLPDGANLHCTIISPNALTIGNQKTMVLTQVGSDIFNKLIAESTNEYSGYSEGTHTVDIKITGNSTYSAYQNGKSKVVGSFFVEDPNTVANNLLGFATGNGNGSVKVDTSCGYENWVKE